MLKKKFWFENKHEDDFFFFFKEGKKKNNNNNNNNKHIVALKKWVSGKVIPFCRKCFRWELEIYFYIVILKFCPYLNIGFRGILEQKKSCPNKEAP